MNVLAYSVRSYSLCGCLEKKSPVKIFFEFPESKHTIAQGGSLVYR